MKSLLTFLLFVVTIINAKAQIDLQCNGRDQHSIYVINLGNGFYRIDSVDTHPTAPVFLQNNSSVTVGISINKNLNNTNPPVTMYTVDSHGEYYYLDDTGRVDTHYSTGSVQIVNIGGTAQYIFNVDPGSWQVYRYNGTSNDTIINMIPFDGQPLADVATDRNGNFYLYFISGNKIISYTPNGIPIDSFYTTGISVVAGGGFTILGQQFYITNNTYPQQLLYKGTMNGDTINFSVIASLPSFFTANDIASCPDAAEPLAVFKNPEAPHFIIYPNPATNNAIIKLDNADAIDITDCMGRKILSAPVRGLAQYKLSLSGYTPGVYFVTATSPHGLAEHHSLVVQ